jgi:putative DNA primase/helicase
VRRGIRRFVKWLEFNRATVKVIWLPPKADGSKCGLDDFIAERKARGLTDEEIRRDLLLYALDEIPGEDAFENDGPSFKATDLGNAERFIHQHKDKVRFCHKWKKWLVWNDQRWLIDDTAAVYRMAQETTRSIYTEASRQLEEEKRQVLGHWAMMSERLQRIDAMISLASKQETVAVLPDDLDKDSFLLNVNNGTLDLRTGTLRPHHRDDLLTKLAPVDYDPDAEMPLIKEFLLEIMQSSSDMISFIQRMLGYSLTGDTREQILPICFGVGANGKTTLLGLFLEMLGDYATATSTSMLMVKRNESIPCDLAALKGARFVTASEVEDGQRFAESKVKELTGGDLITARHLYGDPFTFKPNFKIWLCVNHKPTIRGTDTGIWRRIRLIPFTVVITKDKQDKSLPQKLREDLPGLLAWAVAGCLEWQKNGLGVPDAIEQATDGYKEEMDVLGQFLNERCTVHEDMAVQSSKLYEAWKSWCAANGEAERSNKWLTQRMEEKGFISRRRNTGVWFLGIGLNDADDD